MREDYRVMADFILDMTKKNVWLPEKSWSFRYMRQLADNGYCVQVDDNFVITKKGRELAESLKDALADSNIFAESLDPAYCLSYMLEEVFDPIFGKIDIKEIKRVGIVEKEGGNLIIRDAAGSNIFWDSDIKGMEGKKVEVTFKVVE